MKVYQFDYEVDYGGGIMLVSANDENEAREFVEKNVYVHRGFWVFDGIREDLTYNGSDVREILTYRRCE